jgi:hypothetical protein
VVEGSGKFISGPTLEADERDVRGGECQLVSRGGGED